MEGVDVFQGTQLSDPQSSGGDNSSGPAAVAPALPRIAPQMVLQQQVPAVDGLNSRFQDMMLNNEEGDWEEEFCTTI